MKLSKELLAVADLHAESFKFSEPVKEGLGKTVARLVTGKTVGARANQEKERSFNALRAGDTKAAEKHMQRHLSFEKLMGKNLNYKAIRALADDELNKMYKSIGGASYADAQYVKLRQGLKDEIVRRKSLKEDESFDQHTMLPEAVEQINLLLAEGKISGFKPPFKYDTKSGILNSVIDSAGKNVCDAKTRMIARNIVDALNSFTKPTVTEAVKAMTAWDVLNNIAETKHGEHGFATLSDSEASMYINMRAANKLASDESGEDSFMQLSEKEMKNIVNANPDLLKGMARKMNTKSVVSSAVYIPTSDDKRLEKQIKTAMDKGDDYTAKSYAKMAETSDGRKYLNSIIKQLMKPLKESSENKKADELEVGDRVVITGKVMHQGDEGEIVEFGKDKKFVTVKLDNDNKTRSFHSTDVTDLKAKYEDDDEEDDFEDQPDEDVFYVAVVSMDDSDGGDGFVGKVAIIDGKWRELPAVGKPHYKWGQKYMGYLSQSDIMQYIKKDFGRYYDVKGPFNTLADAKDEAEDSGLELDESVQNMTSSFMNKAFSTSTVNEDSIDTADKNKLLKLLGALKQRSKAANLSSGEKYMISDRMERIQGRLDALDKKVDESIDVAEGWTKIHPDSQERENKEREGRRVKTPDGEGVVTRERKVPTFSQMVPFVHEITVKLDSGKSTTYRAKMVKFLKDTKVDESITYTDIEDWKKAVKNSYPQHASKIRFNGRMEGGKMTVSAEVPGEDRCFGVWDQEDEKGEVLSESTNLERKQKRIGLMIDDYIKRSKATTNDIKKSHYLDMADQLRAQLADLKLTEADEPSEDEKENEQIIAKADEYRVRLYKDTETVDLLDGEGTTLVTMPLVIWKQLTRQ